jgi:multiple sugar transport system ATP-binding protein
MTMGNRIAVLKDGNLQQVGTPLEVYEGPRNLFVAQFIGSPPMNFLDAQVGEGGRTLQGKAFQLPVPAAWQAAAASAVGRRVKVGVRPEHLIGPGSQANGPTAPLELGVEIIETLGNELVVHGRVGEELLVWKQDPHRPSAVGDRVPVQLELDAMHLFDAQTEQRLGA